MTLRFVMATKVRPTSPSSAAPRAGATARRRKQRGQSLVEFAISSIVLLLLMMGLLDLSRAFYFAVNMEGAAREGARHGAWFDTAGRYNPYLYDDAVMQAVNQGLQGAGVTATQIKGVGCLAGADGNPYNNKPYAAGAYPATTGSVFAYVCYTSPGGATQLGTRPTPPSDNSWRLGDINVSLLMNFALITPLIQNIFGNGLKLAFNEHFTIQGKP